MPRSNRPVRGTLAALVVVGTAAAAAMVLLPVARPSASGGRCGVAADLLAQGRPLPHVAERLLAGGEFTIVTLGSSSTSGTGASNATATYPSRLGALLAKRYPGLKVRVVNRGVPGEEAPEMAARIGRDVLPEKPDLVIWQVGTNGLVDDDESANALGDVVRAGIERIRAAGADVMLMNPQYAPAVLRNPRYRDVLHMLDAVAYAEDVPLVPRFAMMRQWADDGRMTLGVMLSRDRLHMTDVSYDCLARQVAASIDGAAAPPDRSGES